MRQCKSSELDVNSVNKMGLGIFHESAVGLRACVSVQPRVKRSRAAGIRIVKNNESATRATEVVIANDKYHPLSPVPRALILLCFWILGLAPQALCLRLLRRLSSRAAKRSLPPF
jgi:hypothetical protein